MSARDISVILDEAYSEHLQWVYPLTLVTTAATLK
jgi:hypothetical protein